MRIIFHRSARVRGVEMHAGDALECTPREAAVWCQLLGWAVPAEGEEGRAEPEAVPAEPLKRPRGRPKGSYKTRHLTAEI